MMDPSGTNNFEEQWRKAFQEASETPPPSVWDKIEAHLDQESHNDKLVPLWWKSARIWYAAASVAALLVAGNIWYSNTEKRILSQAQIAAGETVKNQKSSNEAASSENAQPQADAVQTPAHESIAAAIKEGNAASSRNSARETSARKNASKFNAGNRDFYAKNTRSNRVNRNENAIGDSAPTETSATPVAAASVNVERPDEASVASNAAPDVNTSPNLLNPLAYSDLDVHMQKRYVFFRPDAPKEEPLVPATKNKEYWAAVGVMPASFNPDLKVKEAPQAFNVQSLSSRKSTSGTSQSGASYALQTQGGVRLSKHWTVEMGLSYLKANSTYEGGGYVLSANDSRTANVIENALADMISRPVPGKTANFASSGALYIDVAKPVNNDYQYLQLPVQAGFTLRPDKKLSYSVLGGMMANFFLSNELEAASGDMITTTASDEIYRTMNWAATTGLRFNYRMSTHWNANLTGSYQKSVSSGFRSNQNLDAHPYLYGVSWGVRYTF